MNPRKIIFVFLLLVACGVWVYDINLLLGGKKHDNSSLNESETEKIIPDKYEYRADFPDPFICRQLILKETKTAKKSKPNRTSKSIESTITLPACKIGGIVYSPNNPMAIFISGGRSQLVKKGDVVDSIIIVSITQHNVEVSYRGKKFTINK